VLVLSENLYLNTYELVVLAAERGLAAAVATETDSGDGAAVGANHGANVSDDAEQAEEPSSTRVASL
jgi:hypothetical protein